MLILLVGTGIFLTVRTRFLTWRNLGYALKSTLSKEARTKSRGQGDVSPFSALTTALAATIGTGNIVGVATAMVSGGPGALVWNFSDIANALMAIPNLICMLLLSGEIAKDVKEKLGGETIGVIFPILSRNRFSICLKGIAKGAKKVILMLSYPSDEVGNALVSLEQLDEAGINPYSDVLDEKRYRELFGKNIHPFTGVDYVEYYSEVIREAGADVEVIFANQPQEILKYTKNVLACDIHSRERTKRILKANGAERVYGMDDILTSPVDGSGCNERFGLLGSNKSTEESVKLFPRECTDLVLEVQKQILDKTCKHVEVMVYGDGAFKDPVGKIWELADPCVSVANTEGLEGTPNELKLKYLADNDFKDLSGEALKEAISKKIKEKDDNLVGNMVSQGTTPRRLTDLIGSLCDLTSGSGDKGTPVILIQGYFDNMTDN